MENATFGRMSSRRFVAQQSGFFNRTWNIPLLLRVVCCRVDDDDDDAFCCALLLWCVYYVSTPARFWKRLLSRCFFPRVWYSVTFYRVIIIISYRHKETHTKRTNTHASNFWRELSLSFLNLSLFWISFLNLREEEEEEEDVGGICWRATHVVRSTHDDV